MKKRTRVNGIRRMSKEIYINIYITNIVLLALSILLIGLTGCQKKFISTSILDKPEKQEHCGMLVNITNRPIFVSIMNSSHEYIYKKLKVLPATKSKGGKRVLTTPIYGEKIWLPEGKYIFVFRYQGETLETRLTANITRKMFAALKSRGKKGIFYILIEYNLIL